MSIRARTMKPSNKDISPCRNSCCRHVASNDPSSSRCRTRRRSNRIRQYHSVCSTSLLVFLLLTLTHPSTAFLLRPQTSVKRISSSSIHRLDASSSSSSPTPINGDASHSSRNLPSIPKHVAFVCDGNSRWAQARNFPAAAGHAAGADRLVEVLDALKRTGVVYCTMYGFSTENWRRPPQEVQDILSVMETTARRFYNRILQEDMRIRIIGDLKDNRIPSGLRDILETLELKTNSGDKKLTLCLAINYGGRQDILNAAKKMAEALAADETLDVNEEAFASCLSTSGIPDPDMIIRTSGESRLSNFLLWNAAYSELYFTNVLWPDFDEVALNDALDWYSKRKRRFGAREILPTYSVSEGSYNQ